MKHTAVFAVALSAALAAALIVGLCGKAAETPAGVTRPAVTAEPEKLTVDELMHRTRQFHGHLGPWMVLGLRMGEYALDKLKADKYFGMDITVQAQASPPQPCAIDGLQFSTGCTMGKLNMHFQPVKVAPPPPLRATFATPTDQTLILQIKPDIPAKFAEWIGKDDEEVVFKRVYSMPAADLFTEVEP